MIAGDWNAASSLWGYSDTNNRGSKLIDIMLKFNLKLLNTYKAPPTWEGFNNKIGWPDITFATDGLAPKIQGWKVLEEESLSDHKYITFNLNIENNTYARENFETKKGQHAKFENLSKSYRTG